jgi:acyl carrier protein
MNIREKLKEKVAESLHMSAEEISDNSRFKEDLAADSIDMIEIIMSLENEYNVTVDTDLLLEIKTVGQAAEMIEKLIK